MKANSIIVSFLLALTLSSCKLDTKKETQKVSEETKKDIAYTITLKAIVTVDDSFQLFYKEADEIPYEESTILTLDVKGKPEVQDIVFNVEEGTIPYFLRIDLGSSEKQQPMLLKSIKFAHQGKSFEIPGEQFISYFFFNECVKITDNTSGWAITPTKLSSGIYDPLIYSGDALFQKIDALTKGK